METNIGFPQKDSIYGEKNAKTIENMVVLSAEEEIARFNEAKEKSILQLVKLKEKALLEVGSEEAKIFSRQAMMLEYVEFNEAIEDYLDVDGINAERAVQIVTNNFVSILSEMDDDCINAKPQDILDIGKRLLENLSNKSAEPLLNETKIYGDQKSLDEQEGFPGIATITMGSKKVILAANLNSLEEIDAAFKNNAEGYFFSSDSLYLNRNKLPDEEEQFEVYKNVLQSMGNRNVLIRTLYISADTKTNYLDLQQKNITPKNSYKIPICLEKSDVLRTQLRALYRASVFGNLAVVFPMVIDINEINRISDIVNEIKVELWSEGLDFNEIPLGIMMESPAEVLESEELANTVDFFSIETDNLVLYCGR